MLVFRLLRVTLHLVTALLICVLVFPFFDTPGRLRHIRRWSIQLLSICRVQLEIEHCGGASVDAPALLVANHVSWLDIFVINAMHPYRFVAKSDIRDWPLIGWLCARTGTVFIARGRLRDVRRIFQDLVASLRNNERIAFFPEGTTAAQGSLLPFHANLFEAAIDANIAIRPCALRYLDPQGRLHPAVDFVGDMTFVQSMVAILSGQKITARLMVLQSIGTAEAQRRELAEKTREAIAAALGYSD